MHIPTLVITMSISFSQELLISTLVLLVPLYLYFRSSSRSKSPIVIPTNWPILYTFPSFLANIHNLHDYVTKALAGSGHNLRAHGPPGTGMRFFITCDPANARHIFTKNYTNFPKGPDFAGIFDIMDGSLFTIDGELVHRSRTKIQGVLSNPRLVACTAASCHEKLENCLLPLFADMASTDTPFDMQELMARFMFDLTTMTLIGVDPGLLSIDVPLVDASSAMDKVMEVGFLRHMMPTFCWKAMRWLNIGQERKLHAAHAVLQEFFLEMMERRKMIDAGLVRNEEEEEGVYILSSYITDPDYADGDLLQATLISFMLGGRDTIGTTLPWIFYILAKNPNVVTFIRNELSPIASNKVAGGMGAMMMFGPEETKSLVYLGAMLHETLRLYPPGPFVRKTVAADDTMPSGHVVHAGDTTIVSLYSMGRMEGVWGKDCLDYNPDRWLSDSGNQLKYVPSHQFLAFNSGPRICPGKDIAVMLMKSIVAAVVWNFDVELVEGQTIQPKTSCLLQMKNGLTVKLKKREM